MIVEMMLRIQWMHHITNKERNENYIINNCKRETEIARKENQSGGNLMPTGHIKGKMNTVT